ncbi:MAG: GGDEF domain-containing protein [Actinomycetota bacterium]
MDRIDELTSRARRWGFERIGDNPVPDIERAMEGETGLRLARLYEARGSATQADDPYQSESDCLAAAAIYAAEGEASRAASLAATAATIAEWVGDWDRAIEHAVAATIQLADVELDDEPSAQATIALCVFYGHMGAFELAVPFGRRATEIAKQIGGMRLAASAFNHGYQALEGALSTPDDIQREQWLDESWSMATILQESDDASVSKILGAGLAAEVLLVRDELDEAATLMADAAELGDKAAPNFRPWFQFVTACVRHRFGELIEAERLLTEAIPGLETASDDHCLIRALRTRAAVREERGDLTGAIADLRRESTLVRRWQLDRTAHYASLIASQAELERDGSMLRRQAGELARAATEDPLTGLFSRRWLMRRLNELETLDQTGAVLMIDIDHFKEVNDTHGHSVGDRVLTAVSSVLTGSMRDGDVVRYGGEEFLVAITTDARTAAAVAERARLAVTHASFDDILPDLRLTISVGVAHGSMRRIRELIEAADDALYVAKQSGRNRVVTADPLPEGAPDGKSG